MAKQTFTTGQVLTAAQMTSLQQTAMGGGSATAKTASYVLVAADAGATVIMNSASSTTITVNTNLFAAGDTVLIMNIGTGTCTVTAGTATVSTAGSLALTQYESGILYFTATGTAVFNDYVQASSNPLTTTGDMIYSSSGSTQARIGIGSTGQVLTVASGIPSWAAASGGGMTLLSTTNLTGSTVTVSSIDQTYNNLYLLIENAYPPVDTYMYMTANSDTTTANYQASLIGLRNSTMAFRPDNKALHAYGMDGGTARSNLIAVTLFNYAGSTYKCWSSYASIYGDSTSPFFINSFGNTIWYDTAAITSLTFTMSASTFSGGTVKIYGVK